MKVLIKLLLTVFVFCMITEQSNAQEKKLEFAITAGFAKRLAIEQFGNTGTGFHIGANMYKRDADRFTSDAQLSFNYVNLDNSLTDILMVNALYGVRYYFSKSENSTRVFLNALVGPAYKNESGDDFIESAIDIGYSGGLFMESKKMVFGVSIDSPQNLIFKIGLTF